MRLQDKLSKDEYSSNTRVELARPTDRLSGVSSEAELNNLRRLCKQQAEQLSTQDETIRRLRQHN